MAKIEVGRFSELLRRYLSMSGVVEVAQELAPEISPVFILEAERPEWEFLKGAKLCSCSLEISALAGFNSTLRIRNPVGSGVIAIFGTYDWWFNNSSDLIFARNAEVTDLLTPVVTTTRDTRYPALNASALLASADNVAFTGDFWWTGHGLETLNSTQVRDIPFILTPGFCLEFSSDTFNVRMRGGVSWLERRLDPLEAG